MVEPYLTGLKTIIERFRSLHPEMNAVSCKHFFNGAAAYMDEKIFMSLSPVGLALKLAEDDCSLLFAQGATPLQYFPKAPIKKGYAVLPPQLVDDEEVLVEWVIRCIKFAGGKNGTGV